MNFREAIQDSTKCDCYAMFGQPHFHDCPVAKKEASMHELLKHVPPQYLKDRLSYDLAYSNKHMVYQISGGGYVLAETEDAELADAICKVFNQLRESEAPSAEREG